MSILRGLHVVEVSGNGSAAMAGKHLADWGARVTALEPVEGTPLRDEPPYYQKGAERRSATWQWLSRGKTVVRVGDAAALSQRDALGRSASADVLLVEAGMAQRVLGIAPGDLRAHFVGETTCVAIAPFALDGPYADYDVTDLGVNALGGWMSVLGDPRREPLSPGRALIWRVAGVFAFVAALVALRGARQGGRPQFVELSAQAVAASMISAPWLVKSMLGVNYDRTGNAWPLGTMECADGYVACPPLTGAHWELLCQLMGIADVLEDPRSRDPVYRVRHGARLYERVKPWLRGRSREEVFTEAQAWRLPAAPVQTIDERLRCPQLSARGFWTEAEIDGATVHVPRVPYRIEGVAPVERGPAWEVEGVDLPPAGARSGNRPPAPPFAGLRVVDLTSFWSGPYATSLLGALGADVIKVESIQRPDPYRYTLASMRQERWYEWGAVFHDCNVNKRGVTLDLGSAAGRELFERLAEQADVVISNFATRVMPNLGLSSGRLLRLNPRLIAVTMPGYGPGGPWEQYVGYAIPFEQLLCASMTGYPDGPPIYLGGFCDPLVGMHTVAAIELALRRREETGRGVEVEVPQCEVLESLFAPEHIARQLGAPLPGRRGNKHEWMAPHEAYRVAGDDEWLTIAVSSDEEFAALARTIGLDELLRDDRFATVAARKEHERELDAVIAGALRERAGDELERALQAAGVKACRVLKGYRLTEDANLRRMGFFQSVARAVTGTQPYKTWPFRFSDIDTTHKRPPPLLGEHNHEVLSSWLRVSSDELSRLERDGVIGSAPLGLGG